MIVSAAFSQVGMFLLLATISTLPALQKQMHPTPLQCPRDTEQLRIQLTPLIALLPRSNMKELEYPGESE